MPVGAAVTPGVATDAFGNTPGRLSGPAFAELLAFGSALTATLALASAIGWAVVGRTSGAELDGGLVGLSLGASSAAGAPTVRGSAAGVGVRPTARYPIASAAGSASAINSGARALRAPPALLVTVGSSEAVLLAAIGGGPDSGRELPAGV